MGESGNIGQNGQPKPKNASLSISGRPSEFQAGKKTANIFTQQYQDPFKQRVSSILDPIAAAEKDGTLTYDQAFRAQQRFESELADFESSASQFELAGGPDALVVKQARETLNPIIATWRTSLTATLGKLPKLTAGTNDPKAPSTETPRLKAQGAAEQQRKRTMSSQGRSSTILTRGTLTPTGKAKTILGY